MASRQGGVHVSYLIVAMVISLGLIVAVVMVNNDKAEIAKRLKSAVEAKNGFEAKEKKALDQRNKLRVALTGGDDEQPDLAQVQAALASNSQLLADHLGRQGAESYRGYVDYLKDTEELVKKLVDQRDRHEAQADANLTKFENMLGESTQVKTSTDEAIASNLDNIGTLQTQVEQLKKESREESERLRAELAEATEQFTAETANLNNDLWVKEALLSQANQRIDQLYREINAEVTLADVRPDGEIIRVSTEGFAWIDIGRDEYLRRGLVFDVFQYIKGGKKLRKGTLEIVAVNDDYAQARISDTYDPLNPIAGGDKISSPFYDPSETPMFVVAGDKLSSNRATLEEVRARITRSGGKLSDSVNAKTSFCVVVEGYEETEAYKEARKLGVTILREHEFLEFLGL